MKTETRILESTNNIRRHDHRCAVVIVTELGNIAAILCTSSRCNLPTAIRDSLGTGAHCKLDSKSGGVESSGDCAVFHDGYCFGFSCCFFSFACSSVHGGTIPLMRA
jgi:hypothetical protein